MDEKKSKKKGMSTRDVALGGVMIAVTAAMTLLVRIPIAPTRGYLNLGDAMVFFSALALGARIGGIAGGVGSAIADILGGYAYFAPITLVVKGVEGLVAGIVGKKGTLAAMFAGTGAGGACMLAGYFIAETLMYGVGPALVELPANVIQVVGGLAIAIPLTIAVRKAYPGIRRR